MITGEGRGFVGETAHAKRKNNDHGCWFWGIQVAHELYSRGEGSR